MTLDKYEFSKGMSDFMLGFSQAEVDTLFNYFDVNRDGLVDYNEFLRTVRGPMNATRVAITNRAFDKFDRDGNGYIDINDLIGLYDGTHHPDVKSGKKTETQVFQEFLRTYQQHHECRHNNAPDHIVTREEFIEYYNNISASIDDDVYFTFMMNSCWNLDNSRVTKAGWGNQYGTPNKVAANKPVSAQQVHHMTVGNWTPQKTETVSASAYTPVKAAPQSARGAAPTKMASAL